MAARRLWSRLLVPSLLLFAPVSPAAAADPDYRRFFGEYVGEAVSGDSGRVETRDISAKIGPAPKGFTVSWLMNIHRVSGKEKHVEPRMSAFEPSCSAPAWS